VTGSYICLLFADGFRNISNNLSIGTKIDRKCAGLEKKAQEAGVWDGSVRHKRLKLESLSCDEPLIERRLLSFV